eukprot:6175996-Pleurochrysis_carterae.AAC.3
MICRLACDKDPRKAIFHTCSCISLEKKQLPAERNLALPSPCHCSRSPSQLSMALVALIEDKEINVDRDDDHVSDGHSELNGTGDLTIFSEDRDEHGTSRGVRELRPLQLACIASRDVVMQMPGVSVELGCHYGLDYWRGRLTDYSDAPRPQ